MLTHSSRGTTELPSPARGEGTSRPAAVRGPIKGREGGSELAANVVARGEDLAHREGSLRVEGYRQVLWVWRTFADDPRQTPLMRMTQTERSVDTPETARLLL